MAVLRPLERLSYSPVDPAAPMLGRCWRGPRGCLAAGALALAASLVIAAVALVSRYGVHQTLPIGVPLQGKDQIPCTQIRNDVDFWTRMGLNSVGNVSSAEGCRSKCQENLKCDAWTWGKKSGLLGITHVCYLKHLEPGEQPKQVLKPGVVSGFSCRQMWRCMFADGVEYSTAASLRQEKHVSSAEICRATCRAAPGCRAWTWGKPEETTGLAEVCSLKKLEDGERPNSAPKAGVVSGLSCVAPGALSPGFLASEGMVADPGVAAVDQSSSTSRPSTTPPPPVTTGSPAPTTAGTVAEVSTTARTTTARLPAATPRRRRNASSLFCFALMVPFGYEPGLMQMQYDKGVSLFACDEYEIFSNRSASPDLSFAVSLLNMSLDCKRGGEFHTQLNLHIFAALWAAVVRAGRYKIHDWTVKVDADSVFFPRRLRRVLAGLGDAAGQPDGLYLNNCRFGLHGPLEVFSRAAVHKLGANWHRCRQHFHKLCQGPCWWGEDLFVDQCLSQFLDVKRQYDKRLLSEERCDPPQGWASCEDADKVAFHPFKATDLYRRCLHRADKAENEVFFK